MVEIADQAQSATQQNKQVYIRALDYWVERFQEVSTIPKRTDLQEGDLARANRQIAENYWRITRDRTPEGTVINPDIIVNLNSRLRRQGFGPQYSKHQYLARADALLNNTELEVV